MSRDWITDACERSLGPLLERLGPVFDGKPDAAEAFRVRLDEHYETIFRLTDQLYGWRWDYSWHLIDLVAAAAEASRDRKKWLRKRDALDPGAAWMTDPESMWAMTYLDRFVGNVRGLEAAVPHLRSLGVTHLHLMPPYAVPEGPNDGGYAVSDYRSLRPDLGTIQDLRRMTKRLHGEGIGLVLDFVANHTAHDHGWAEAAKRAQPPFDRFFFMFDERSDTEPWGANLRAIFPDRTGDAFTWSPEARGPNGGKWVWTTFHEYQWDLDYRQFEVLVAAARELMWIANLGVAAIRMDATPFLWKREWTSSENLPEVHVVLQILEALMAVVAPSVRFLSEAIVHPDAVQRFIRPDECSLSYNPLLMSVIWEALASRDTALLADALTRRQQLPDKTQWITYLRSHDDIGWGFADEDARARSIDPGAHRRYLNQFYSGEFPGSFATGARFQDNPTTGDARISGTLASLAGLEQALATADPHEIDLAVNRIIALFTLMFTSVGVPMIFLGDEVATCNDHRFAEDPDHADDNRWMHRPRFDWDALRRAEADPASPQGRVLEAVRRLAATRSRIPGIGEVPVVTSLRDPRVIAYRHAAGRRHAMVVVNLSPDEVQVVVDDLGVEWSDIEHGLPIDWLRPLLPYEAIVGLAEDSSNTLHGLTN